MKNIFILIATILLTHGGQAFAQKSADISRKHQINVRQGDTYLIEVSEKRARNIGSWIVGSLATGIGSAQMEPWKRGYNDGQIFDSKTNIVSSISLGSAFVAPYTIKRSKTKNLFIYYQILPADGSQSKIMSAILKKGMSRISGKSDKDGVLSIILPDSYDGEITASIKSVSDEKKDLLPAFNNGSIDTLGINGDIESRSFEDSLPSGDTNPGGTFDPVDIYAPQNPCFDNPFVCGCPLQSPSCNDPQPNDIDLTFPPAGSDPCVSNPCLCGNCGGSAETPDEDDLDEEFPNLNACERSYALSNMKKAVSALYIMRYMDNLFNTNDSLLFAGGNADDTRANAMKHFLWNIKMICQANLDQQDAQTIAQNHEICNGVRTNSVQQFNMDTHNNAKGQEYASQVINAGKCNDEGYLVYFAFSKLSELVWLQE